MGVLKNPYVLFSLLVVVFLSFTLFNTLDNTSVITGKVTEAVTAEKLLFDCSFDNSNVCKDGEKPTKEEGLAFVEGKLNTGIYVSPGDVLEYTTTDNFNISQGTLSFWIKPDWDASSEGAHCFFYTRRPNWEFYFGTENFNDFLYFNVRGYGVEYPIKEWAANDWHYITLTWERLELKVYIDGVYQRKTSFIAPPDNPDKIYIGSANTQTKQAKAVIDELKIYNYVRTYTQIKQDYDSYIEEKAPVTEAPAEVTAAEETPEEPVRAAETVQAPVIEQPSQSTSYAFLWVVVVLLLLVIAYLVVLINKKKK